MSIILLKIFCSLVSIFLCLFCCYIPIYWQEFLDPSLFKDVRVNKLSFLFNKIGNSGKKIISLFDYLLILITYIIILVFIIINVIYYVVSKNVLNLADNVFWLIQIGYIVLEWLIIAMLEIIFWILTIKRRKSSKKEKLKGVFKD